MHLSIEYISGLTIFPWSFAFCKLTKLCIVAVLPFREGHAYVLDEIRKCMWIRFSTLYFNDKRLPNWTWCHTITANPCYLLNKANLVCNPQKWILWNSKRNCITFSNSINSRSSSKYFSRNITAILAAKSYCRRTDSMNDF